MKNKVGRFLKVFLVGFGLLCSAGLWAQESVYFVYDKVEVNSIIQDISESTVPSGFNPAPGEDPFIAWQPSNFGLFLIGVIPGILLPAAGLYFALSTGNALIGCLTGSILGVFGPPVLIGIKTKNWEKIGLTFAGSIMPIAVAAIVTLMGNF